MPEAVANAMHPSPDTLQASDGHTYTRDRDGQWNTPGMIWGSNAADGNLRRELDATRCAEQAAADHGHAAMPTLTLRAFSDPDHPQHALFNTLRSAFPQGTSNERLHQATAACYTAGIRQPQHLSGIMGNDSAIHFRSTILGAPPGQMDMTKPAPAVPQTLQQVQTHDQQHAQMMSQVHAQNPQFNQPASQLPMPGGR
jgi:hypothetical protein